MIQKLIYYAIIYGVQDKVFKKVYFLPMVAGGGTMGLQMDGGVATVL